ncbi:GNAT family N-acetyltransferase [Paenibacillus sp. MMS20-IR301]|uniref:GNAT family N-acetyltransferase n=1 Tax=Paenibacillus sp. MMS20-IR301 TaxID=2895946 RepID=UPI0028EC967F|nr:GNAT family N-acetyltransferase [Paenibacillus sp. MMS20-IR301]WNS45394.1 GNAT family N-acetyltransferase [Paenibacillus sp. MMS20-IR301]
MSIPVLIRQMGDNDIAIIHGGLLSHDVSKPLDYIESCWKENLAGQRMTLLAFRGHEFAGWGHVVFQPQYSYFADNQIPEIQNFDIIPPFRHRGIGSVLAEALEEAAFARSRTIGIGFGLYASYGTAQRMYIRRGFIPDGRGLMYDNIPAEPGSQVRVDDELTLYLTKSR